VKPEEQAKETESSTVKDMQPPTGTELNPKPPLATRLRKRPGWIVVGVLLVVSILVCYRIYERKQELIHSGSSDEKKRVEPATRAGQQITKDIPPGVVNLADETKKIESVDSRPGAQPPKSPTYPDLRAPSGAPEHKLSSVSVLPLSEPVHQPVAAYQPVYPPPMTPEPRKSSIDERLLAAYERELQAIASPTSIQTENAPGTPQSLNYSTTAKPANDASATNALMEALGRTNANAPARERQAVIGNGESDDSNLQTRKEAFLAAARRAPVDDYLNSTRTMPLSKYEIKAGWEIPAVLEQDINSDLPGELKALVTSNVYDTATGKYLLIPQGSRLIGTYDSAVGYGQRRLQAVWNRIIFPDASWVDLGGMLGQDAHGSAGFSHDVDNHYKRLIGFAVLSSVFSAGFQLSQTQRTSVLQTPSPGEIAASAVGQEVSQVGSEITRRNLNVQPTIKAPIGYKFNVRVNRDILFDRAYDAPQVREAPDLR
jgi:type IV secretory pathway VirB10-like protein